MVERAEVALAVILLVGSGLFIASFARVGGIDLGVDHRNVHAFQIRVAEFLTGSAEVQHAVQRNRQLLLSVLERTLALPGVETAALVGGGLPLRGDLRTVNLGIADRELPPNTDIALNDVTPGYFKAMGVPLVRGRFFTDTDNESSEPVVLLNAAAAAKYFSGEDPLGKVVHIRGARTVIGIVGNIRHEGPEADARTQAFVPFTQSPVLGADPGRANSVWSSGRSGGCA